MPSISMTIQINFMSVFDKKEVEEFSGNLYKQSNDFSVQKVVRTNSNSLRQ